MSTPATDGTEVSMTRAEMTFDFDGLIQLLAGHLYSEKKVFIRELIQNGHDAIVRRAHEDQGFDRDQGRIHLLTDLTTEPGRIIFRDNGLGMSRADLERFLSAATLRGYVGAAIQLPDPVYARLIEALPTDSRWHHATDAELAPLLGAAYEDLAPSVLKRVRTGLDQPGGG